MLTKWLSQPNHWAIQAISSKTGEEIEKER